MSVPGLKDKRVVVTGGSGFVGSAVVRRLVSEGASVVSVQRDSPSKSVPHEVVISRVGTDDHLFNVVVDADAVVHLAARAGGIHVHERDDLETMEENFRISRQVAAAVRSANVRAVFFASSAVVYRASDRALGEAAPVVRPDEDQVSGYAWSKLTDEALASWLAASGCHAVVGRLSNVYGPGASFDEAKSTVVHSLIKKAAEAESSQPLRVWGNGNAVRSFIYVDDAADAILRVLMAGRRGGAYNVDSSGPVRIRDLAHLINDVVTGGRLEVEFDADAPTGVPVRVLETAALAALGFKAKTGLRDGIRRTLDGYIRSAPHRSSSDRGDD